MGPNGNSRMLLWIVLGAFVLRFGFGLWWQSRFEEGTRFYFGDSESYWELGQTIAAGEPYQFRSADRKVFRMPGYPLFLSPIFVMLGEEASPLWGRALGAAFGTATVAAVWWLAGLIFDRRAALWAAGATAIYPGAIATSEFILTEAPFGAAMIVQLALWLRYDQCTTRKSSLGWAFATGLVAGAATLIRPSWLLFTPFAGVVLRLLRGKRPLRGVYLNLAIMLAGLCTAMMPWWIRNAIVIGRFVPTTLQVGASLYDGLNPEADGSSNMKLVDERIDRLPHGFAMRGPPALHASPYEYQLNRQLYLDAHDWATQQKPGRALELAAIKFRRLWNIWPNEPSMRSWPVRLGVACSYVPILLLAIGSAWRHRRRGWVIWLCLLPAVYFTLLHVVFVSSIRYRQPAMLALIVLAAGIAAVAKPQASEQSKFSRAA